MRVVAVDFGGRRIGLAVGDSGVGVASPRRNLEASGTLAKDAEAIVRFAESEKAGLVVIGLATDAEGETRQSQVCRKLGERVAALGVEVDYVDESHTSAEAERDMLEAGLKGSERRKRSDAEAACRILERYFERTQ
jgi:putative Holliday junction resolvase